MAFSRYRPWLLAGSSMVRLFWRRRRWRGLAALEGWSLIEEGRAIGRRLDTKSFLRAQALAMVAGGIADLANHHPDISYGWGYCSLRFTTHSAGGVTMNDLICAARVNAAIG
ncbi:4a-hydroxytetrahydrobiopterin dehydratase [Paracoccus cavernae]|uniref:4a-hydroxytetrahydrobiopterin dehydratase n=2 Tax=Paracoccus cavernae TaxID=1571207 RepID=A0ABT8DBY3_9RHOB|nr:4a-hydroxytetrahydrobiopterin dehydratase [Paracoccus cavernae]